MAGGVGPTGGDNIFQAGIVDLAKGAAEKAVKAAGKAVKVAGKVIEAAGKIKIEGKGNPHGPNVRIERIIRDPRTPVTSHPRMCSSDGRVCVPVGVEPKNFQLQEGLKKQDLVLPGGLFLGAAALSLLGPVGFGVGALILVNEGA